MNATAPDQAHEILARIDQLRPLLAGHLLVSQNRWVDHWLDLFNLMEQPALRRVAAETLSDMSNLRVVEAGWMLDRLEELAAAVEVESAFDCVVEG